MPNKWVEHVKQYAKKHNLSYGCAVSDPGCKSSYHAGKDVPPLETPMRTSRVIKATPPKGEAPKPKPKLNIRIVRRIYDEDEEPEWFKEEMERVPKFLRTPKGLPEEPFNALYLEFLKDIYDETRQRTAKGIAERESQYIIGLYKRLEEKAKKQLEDYKRRSQ
jgi:hypothetical protein